MTTRRMSFTVGSLFAGYGGLELGLSQVLDAEPAWFSEIEKAPSKILAHHWPAVPNLGDVTRIDWSAVEPVDVITGGSPCQDLSHAGKRAGMRAGTRSGLWAAMCDAIDIIRPSLVLWENVRGALSASADSAVEPCPVCVGDGSGPTLRALGRVLGDLAELGYDTAWTGLRAADVGAPHGRWRVFVLAWPAADADDGEPHVDPGADWPSDVWAEQGRTFVRPRGRGGLPAWGSPEWRDLTLLPSPRTSDTNGAGAHGQGGLDLRTAVSLLPTPNTLDYIEKRTTHAGGNFTLQGAVGGVSARDAERHGLLPTPSAVNLLPTPNASLVGPHGERGPRTLESRQGKQVELPDVIAHGQWGDYAPAIARWEALTRPAPAPTEPTGKGGAHRLSPRFVEWMMGLPDGWVTDVPDVSRNDALKALGNGVVPQQAAAAVRHLLGVREAHATKAVAA